MWLKLAFAEDQNGRIIIAKYRLEEEGFVDAPPTTTTPYFMTFNLGKTRMTVQKFIYKGTVRINMRMTAYEEWIDKPLPVQPPLIRADVPSASAMSQFF